MKKLSIIILTFGLFFISCSDKIETKIMKNMYQDLDKALETKTDTFKYVDVYVEKIYLSDLAEKYLGDGLRHMEIANLNYKIFQDFDRYRVTGSNPHWDYAEARLGERIYLPKDAVGSDIMSEYIKRTYLKKGLNIKDYYKGDLPVIVSGNLNSDEQVVTKKYDEHGMGFFPWLMLYILPLILAIGLLALLGWFFYWLFNQRINQNQQTNECCDEVRNNTNKILERIENDNCCDDINNNLVEIKKHLSDYQKVLENPIDNTTSRLGKLSAILNTFNSTSGENGNVQFSYKDDSLKIKMNSSKSADFCCLKKEYVEKMVFDILGEEIGEEEIILILKNGKFPKFKSKEELKEYIKDLKKLFKDQNKKK